MSMTKRFLLAAVAAGVMSTGTMLPVSSAQAADAKAIAEGKALAFNRKKGNCLACHAVDDGVSPGNVAPPLVAMKARFPDKAKLRTQIADATIANPNTMMPPFGRHKILNGTEIDKIVEYIYSL